MAVEIKLLLADDGQLHVTGPLHDKILMFGLLRIAEDFVSRYRPEDAQKVARAPAGALKLLNGDAPRGG